MRRIFLVFFLLACITSARATTSSIYEFSTNKHRHQFNELITQLRCMVCVNETLADSDASLAKDMRLQVYQMVKAGKTNKEIKHYLSTRYGDFILFKPPVNSTTWVLWFGPFLFLFIGFTILFGVVRKKND